MLFSDYLAVHVWASDRTAGGGGVRGVGGEGWGGVGGGGGGGGGVCGVARWRDGVMGGGNLLPSF